VTGIENFFLAADYVRTHTDIVTMESANEAARRATNGILAASAVTAPACALWESMSSPRPVPTSVEDRATGTDSGRGVLSAEICG
jgi:uncharacterized protein with NAD-binding domain and iron-sulfur cluster